MKEIRYIILNSVIISTLLLATFNSYEQELLKHIFFFIFTIILSVFPSVLSILLMYKMERKKLFTRYIFTIIAYITSFTGLFAYIYYAFNGKSFEGASHMHVVVFPIMLTIFFIILTLIGFLIIFIYNKFLKK